MPTTNKTGSTVSDKKFSFDKGIITLSAIVAITVVGAVLFKLKTCIRKRKLLSTDHIQEYTSSVCYISNRNDLPVDCAVKINSDGLNAKDSVTPMEPNENE